MDEGKKRKETSHSRLIKIVWAMIRFSFSSILNCGGGHAYVRGEYVLHRFTTGRTAFLAQDECSCIANCCQNDVSFLRPIFIDLA